ncbi:hypothetical protein NDU88_001728 [Pleurodeles waltl]|uniref:Uncharacterized protein n=1 Tax=Pleurodeles waltl TaxID=8319 RepID=A0AAV7R7Y6_PLEWA|nr:hypothetical protein NDU88_001728 [Pleurodeles waltl]
MNSMPQPLDRLQQQTTSTEADTDERPRTSSRKEQGHSKFPPHDKLNTTLRVALFACFLRDTVIAWEHGDRMQRSRFTSARAAGCLATQKSRFPISRCWRNTFAYRNP